MMLECEHFNSQLLLGEQDHISISRSC